MMIEDLMEHVNTLEVSNRGKLTFSDYFTRLYLLNESASCFKMITLENPSTSDGSVPTSLICWYLCLERALLLVKQILSTI